MYQSDSNSQPRFTVNGLSLKNTDSVSFDGVNDYLQFFEEDCLFDVNDEYLNQDGCQSSSISCFIRRSYFIILFSPTLTNSDSYIFDFQSERLIYSINEYNSIDLFTYHDRWLIDDDSGELDDNVLLYYFTLDSSTNLATIYSSGLEKKLLI